MSLIISVRGNTPTFEEGCWIAPNASLIGEVKMGHNCTVWFGAVIRGDVNYIHIGNHTNIQDNATIHGTYQQFPTHIGNYVSIGHNAVIHGCTLEDNVLIGIGAIILDGAVVKSGSIVGAGAVVPAGKIIESNVVVGGIPAKKIKTMDESNKSMLARISKNYTKYASWFKK